MRWCGKLTHGTTCKTLGAIDTKLQHAALVAIDDLAHHRKIGKALSHRNISGDLTGLYRLKFDLDGVRHEQYRIVYRLEPPNTLAIVIIGKRDQHEVYKAARDRLRE